METAKFCVELTVQEFCLLMVALQNEIIGKQERLDKGKSLGKERTPSLIEFEEKLNVLINLEKTMIDRAVAVHD